MSSIVDEYDMKLIPYDIGAGAKGKFSGGFDISGFSGVQEGKGMLSVSQGSFFW